VDISPASGLLDTNDTSQQINRRIVRVEGLLQDLDIRPCPLGQRREHPTPSHARRLSRHRRNLLAIVQAPQTHPLHEPLQRALQVTLRPGLVV